jgi:hypothetical protein
VCTATIIKAMTHYGFSLKSVVKKVGEKAGMEITLPHDTTDQETIQNATKMKVKVK